MARKRRKSGIRPGRPQAWIACPWCLLVDVRFEPLVPMWVLGRGSEELARREAVRPPFVRYRCEPCGYEEIHEAVLRTREG